MSSSTIPIAPDTSKLKEGDIIEVERIGSWPVSRFQAQVIRLILGSRLLHLTERYTGEFITWYAGPYTRIYTKDLTIINSTKEI